MANSVGWPTWTGTAVVIATGPSLTAEQIEEVRLADVKTIAINDAGLVERLPIAAPWADVLYAADRGWWEFYHPDFKGLKVAGERQPVQQGFADMWADLTMNICDQTWEPGKIVHGGHSGFQALQLAITFGAIRVLMIGYDCKPSGTNTNYFGQKPSQIYKKSPYAKWVEGFRELKIPEGVEVINCTPGSAVDAFRRMELGEALASS